MVSSRNDQILLLLGVPMKQKECVIAQTLSSSHLFELVPELASALAYNEAIARPKLIYLLNLLASHLNVNKPTIQKR